MPEYIPLTPAELADMRFRDRAWTNNRPRSAIAGPGGEKNASQAANDRHWLLMDLSHAKEQTRLANGRLPSADAMKYVRRLREWTRLPDPGLGEYLDDLCRLLDELDPESA